MKIAALIARILLGLLFLVFGLNGFLHFIPMPPPSGNAGTFFMVIYTTHFIALTFALEAIGGLLLLVGRFVPLGLVLLAPILVNILTFHFSMAPAGLPLAIVATILWLIVFAAYRKYFMSLFVARAVPV